MRLFDGIQPGTLTITETVATIAQRYHTDPQLISNLNKLQGKKLKAGKSIIVPVSTNQLRQQDKSELTTLARSNNNSANKSRRTYYKVRSGDTLATIARNHKVDLTDLKRWNKLSARSKLAVGQKLVVYPGGKTSDKKQSPTNSGERTTYKVSSGDSLYQIAQRFNVSVKDLQRWNALKGSNLRPGQTLKLYN